MNANKAPTEASDASAIVANKWTDFPISSTPFLDEGGRRTEVALPYDTQLPPLYLSIRPYIKSKYLYRLS
jgi:hypothetical protein